MSKSPMTKIGAERLQEQLHELKTVERPRITAAISEARAHGDLSENAEYHAAREQQSFMEGRINKIESTLSAEIDFTTILNPVVNPCSKLITFILFLLAMLWKYLAVLALGADTITDFIFL